MIVSILAGLGCGLLSGLGIGGGSLLMLYLTAAAGVSAADARGINLLFFLPTALISVTLHAKHGCVAWRSAIPAAVCGCLTGAGLAWLTAGLDLAVLKKAFGAYLLLTGAAELVFALLRTESKA